MKGDRLLRKVSKRLVAASGLGTSVLVLKEALAFTVGDSGSRRLVPVSRLGGERRVEGLSAPLRLLPFGSRVRSPVMFNQWFHMGVHV